MYEPFKNVCFCMFLYSKFLEFFDFFFNNTVRTKARTIFEVEILKGKTFHHVKPEIGGKHNNKRGNNLTSMQD